jgi:small subunit ribosomal protein S16
LVRIRLRRMGTSKLAFYRIVAADSRKAQDGRFLDVLGYYDPLRRPQEIRVDEARIFDWMKRGAQVSETVRSILRRTGTLARWREMQAGNDVTPEVVFLKGSKRTAPESSSPDRSN